MKLQYNGIVFHYKSKRVPVDEFGDILSACARCAFDKSIACGLAEPCDADEYFVIKRIKDVR